MAENNRKEKECMVKALEKQFRERRNSFELEKLLEELNQKSDEYLKTEGCGGELRKREIAEENDPPEENLADGPLEKQNYEKDHVRPRFDRRQSSIIGFDEPFPFKSLGDFLPSFDMEEEVSFWIFFPFNTPKIVRLFYL